MKKRVSSILILGLLILISCNINPKENPKQNDPKVNVNQKEKKDDWEFNESKIAEYKSGGNLQNISKSTSIKKMDFAAEAVGDSLGFSVGGAKDINNFRENIENGYLPLKTDITYEGLFYDYYFDTGKEEECEKLFCPSYSTAVSKDPLSKKEEYYLSVGLNSGMKEKDFQRKKLNLVVVLDISGSMSSPFNNYYYDNFGNRKIKEGGEESEDTNKSKMEIANESVASLLDHLNDDDRFGMVLFDNAAYVAKPLNLVGETDLDASKDHILEITPRGGTNMETGIEKGTSLFNKIGKADPREYENRIIFLTDAMPNTGDITKKGLLGMTESNSENNIYTTFIGIGVDFNTELIEKITKIRGANYYSVHSSEDFKKRMDDEFEYMVTPLVFDLNLKLEAKGFEIEKVYGSPEADEATGEIMKVNTLFPSETEEGETKGGIVILKLKKTSDNTKLVLKTSYEDREGKKDSSEKEIEFDTNAKDFYDNSGIRKGIFLSRYANLMQNWIIHTRKASSSIPPVYPYKKQDFYEIGIPLPPDMNLGQWERQSIELVVGEDFEEIFNNFFDYAKEEIGEIGDENLEKELEVIKIILDSKDNIDSDSRCKWESGNCKILVNSGYYFDNKTQKCEYFPEGSGCSSPPFKDIEECRKICE